MSKRHTIIGSGQYNFDIIKVREYPDGFIIGKRNPYIETIIAEEVGGTCGNVMCMQSSSMNLARWDYPKYLI